MKKRKIDYSKYAITVCGDGVLRYIARHNQTHTWRIGAYCPTRKEEVRK